VNFSSQKQVEIYPEFFYIEEDMKSEDDDRMVMLSHPKDNVATAKFPLQAGTLLTFSDGKKIEVREEIRFGHKIALRKIPKNSPVIKYGERIGRAIRIIEPGQLVHIHNVEGERGKRKIKNNG
jgi:altronate dehydratase small subunit